MDPNVEQILKVSKEISMSSKRRKPNFVWATEDTFKDIQECAEREENKKRCAELEEKAKPFHQKRYKIAIFDICQ